MDELGCSYLGRSGGRLPWLCSHILPFNMDVQLPFGRVRHRPVRPGNHCCRRSDGGCRCPKECEVGEGLGRCILLSQVGHDKVECGQIMDGKVHDLSEVQLSQDPTDMQTVSPHKPPALQPKTSPLECQQCH